MKLVISQEDIWALRLMRPSTHEIGGSVKLEENGRIRAIEFLKGSACRDASGNLLKNTICSVTHPVTPIVIHTHPRANRPSSGDLRNAVEGNNTHLLVTPAGLWLYKAKPSAVEEWHKKTSSEKRRCKLEWRFVGHRQQRNTQSGNTAPFESFCESCGFSIAYIPFTETSANPANKTWTIEL